MNLSFTNGVISAGFERLLTDTHLSTFRQLSQSDFLEMLKTHQYGLTFSKNFEQTMLEEEYKTKQFLESLINKNHILFEVLYLKFNHLFLASLLKSYHLGVKYNETFKGLTTYDEDSFIQYLIFDNAKALNFDDKIFIDKLIENTKNLDAQAISDKVIQILHNDLMSRLKNEDKAIKKYYETYTMIENVLYFVRAKKYKYELNQIEANLLQNDLIDKTIILSYFDKDIKEFGEYLKLHFDESITQSFKDLDAINALREIYNSLELAMSKVLSDFSFDNKSFGLIIYFTLKKREEIVKLKQLYYGVEA